MRPTRAAAVVGVALALSLVPMPAASASAPAHRKIVTQAVAMVRADGGVRADADFDLRHAGRELSAATNTSVAYARCSDCRALAVSFQIVLVRRLPADLAVANRALAVTDRCSRCEALSWAYQWVVVTGTDRRLSPSGQRRLHRLGRELRLLVRSRPAAAELAHGVETLAAQVQQVLASEIQQRPAPRIRSSHARR